VDLWYILPFWYVWTKKNLATLETIGRTADEFCGWQIKRKPFDRRPIFFRQFSEFKGCRKFFYQIPAETTKKNSSTSHDFPRTPLFRRWTFSIAKI
jgi:hypothetical protein